MAPAKGSTHVLELGDDDRHAEWNLYRLPKGKQLLCVAIGVTVLGNHIRSRSPSNSRHLTFDAAQGQNFVSPFLQDFKHSMSGSSPTTLRPESNLTVLRCGN
jgi:hypothetical protein